MNNPHRFPVLSFLLGVVLLVVLVTAPVLAGTESLITINTTDSDQQAPSIHGDWITWEDTRDGSWDIYGYNFVTGEEKRITPFGAIAHDPAQSGDNIVWQDYRNGNYDIFLYNLSTETETQITADPADQSAPAIDGNRIVWQDLRNGNSDIYQFNLSSLNEMLITPGAMGADKKYPAISGNLVVWQDYRNSAAKSDIFMNDTATNTVYNLTPELPLSNQMKPYILGTKVVWKDELINTNGNIWMNESSSSLMSRIDDGPNTAKKNRPILSGTKVIWLDSRNRGPSKYDLYVNDSITGLNTRITTPDANIQGWSDASGYTMIGPAAYNNRIVWTDFRNGNRDIYLYTDSVTETCPVADFTSSVQTGPNPLSVQFMDTTMPGSSPVSHWKWEFGDGNMSSLQDPLFIFTVPGTYRVKLTVNNLYCRNQTPASYDYNISVGAAPVASFTATPDSGLAPLSVAFTDTTVAATAWNWSFGDETFSTLQNPVHSYTRSGTFAVLFNASNNYGYSTATTNIHVLNGVNNPSDTTIDGITISTLSGHQYLSLDTTKLTTTNMGSVLVCEDPLLGNYGWQNITFLSNDGIGYNPSLGMIHGNISGVIFTIKPITLSGFSDEIGRMSSINYSISLPSYPVGGSLNTQVWEGVSASDLASFRKIATMSNFLGVDSLAYTTKIIKTNIPSWGSTQLHMSVNSNWVTQLADGRNHTYVERIADGGANGEVLRTRFLSTDLVNNLDYFEADSPRGSSTFALTLLSGSGNPFQLITLTVASHISPPMDEATAVPTGKATAPVTVQTTDPPKTTAPYDPGRTEKIYCNAQGVITQETRLRSTDTRAQLLLGNGVIAKDRTGAPLSSVSVTAVPRENVPPFTSSAGFVFAGMAYRFEPEGATFSPEVPLTFTYPQAMEGKEYSLKSYDPQSGTWQDLPTMPDPGTGLITAPISHFSYVVLFSKPGASAIPSTMAATPVQTQSPPITQAPPPGTALNIFSGMMLWVTDLVIQNIYLVVILILLGIAYGLRKRIFPGSGW